MNSLTSIRLTNFRGFRDSGSITLRALTFLVGPNSSGKSSLADGILLVSQSINDSMYWVIPDWMGRFVDLGSYKDAVYKHTAHRSITIELTTRIDPSRLGAYSDKRSKSLPELVFQWNLKSDQKSDAGKLHSLVVTDSISGIQVRLINLTNDVAIEIDKKRQHLPKEAVTFMNTGYSVNRVIDEYIKSKRAPPGTKAAYRRIADAFGSYAYQYFFLWIERVSSARSGPKRWVPKGAMQNTAEKFQGLLDDPYTMTLEPSQATRSRIRKRGQPLETVSKYLSKLGIASTITRKDLSAYHGALNVADSVSNVVSNLADVGFGTSQVIPVIRGCISDSFSPLILEQPEIHLHPRAQGELANLICSTSKRRQVIIETHSEHMINRARILVAEGTLKAEDVTILYIDRGKTGSRVTTIDLDDVGDFTTPWPSGFFDERYQDSMRLVELKSRESPVIKLPRRRKGKVSMVSE